MRMYIVPNGVQFEPSRNRFLKSIERRIQLYVWNWRKSKDRSQLSMLDRNDSERIRKEGRWKHLKRKTISSNNRCAGIADLDVFNKEIAVHTLHESLSMGKWWQKKVGRYLLSPVCGSVYKAKRRSALDCNWHRWCSMSGSASSLVLGCKRLHCNVILGTWDHFWCTRK